MCEFDLQFALARRGAVREYIQYKRGAVYDAGMGYYLNVSELYCVQFIIEYYQIGIRLRDR